MKFSPATSVRQWSPALAALIQTAKRLGMRDETPRENRKLFEERKDGDRTEPTD